MNKAVLLLACVIVAAGAWLARDFAFAQAGKEKDEGITMSKQQWEDWGEKRIAAALAKEKADTSDQKIVQPENWHTAIFNGVEYTIYTGPGQVMYRRNLQPAAKPAPKTGTSRPLPPAGGMAP